MVSPPTGLQIEGTLTEIERIEGKLRYPQIPSLTSAGDSHRVELCGSARHDSYFLVEEYSVACVTKFNLVVARPQVEFLQLPGDTQVSAIDEDAGIFVICVQLQLTGSGGCNNHPRSGSGIPGCWIPVAEAERRPDENSGSG